MPTPAGHSPHGSPRRSRQPTLWFLRLFRLAVIAAAGWILHAAAPRPVSADPGTRVPLDKVREFFASAASVDAAAGSSRAVVRDSAGHSLGSVMTTSPSCDALIGYSGPANLLIALNPDESVRGVAIISSADTPAHVGVVRNDSRFWRSFVGWTASVSGPRKVDAVSGSTLTSLAMAEAVDRRLGGHSASRRFPEPVELEEARGLFPEAGAIEADDRLPGWLRVRSREGRLLGFAARTSPHSDNVRGYSGPTESLLGVSPDRRTLIGVRVRRSYDTADYVDRVRADVEYLDSLAARPVDRWADSDRALSGLEGVSGATRTSFAIAEGVRQTLAAAHATQEKKHLSSASVKDIALGGILLSGTLIAFTPLRGQRWLRLLWQLVLIGGFGLWIGQLLSIALLFGWARYGLPWSSAPALVALAALALAAPVGTRRQLYCHHLCPHGAAQEWLGKWSRWRIRLPIRFRRALSAGPFLLLAGAFVAGLAVPAFDLAQVEPFDAWVIGAAAGLPLAIAVGGLVVSLFVPMAYCRFGCPTGGLLRFLRTTGSGDRFGRREIVAVAVLAAGLGALAWRQSIARRGSTTAAGPPASEWAESFSGAAFGTRWSVQIRTRAHAGDLGTAMAAELERIESSLSHWRVGSATAQFNASDTLAAVDLPPELITLVAHAQRLSAATEGAFDVTVAPLVNAWGYGPGGRSLTEPTNSEIAALLESVGSTKLHLDPVAGTMRKSHPNLQIDLGAFLQGYAVDRLASLLDAAGVTEYLIDVGGELRAHGLWRVAIENPDDPDRPLAVFPLRDAALATSSVSRDHHIISPKSGRPVEGSIRQCAVHSSNGLLADGWATALLASGLSRAESIAREHQLSVIVVDANGRRHTWGDWPIGDPAGP